MGKYKVTFYCTTYQSAETWLEADSEAAAMAAAERRYSNGPSLDWRDDDVAELEIDVEESK